MEISKEEVQKKVAEYKSNYGIEPTHIFIYSETQNNIAEYYRCGIMRIKTVRGIEYSEMRNIESDYGFHFDDAKLVAVGVNSDIKVF